MDLLAAEEIRKHFAGFTPVAIGESKIIGGLFGSDIDGAGAAANSGDEAGSGFDEAGSADSDEESAVVKRLIDFWDIVGHFAKPTDVWTDLSAAVAARDRARRIVGGGILEGSSVAAIAATFEEFAVHMDHAARAGLFMQIVYVLRAKEKTVLQQFFEFGERVVTRIRFGGRSDAAAHGVKLPDEARIALPGMRRDHFLDTVAAPKPACTAKYGNAAFCANAGAGKQENAIGGGNCDHYEIVRPKTKAERAAFAARNYFAKRLRAMNQTLAGRSARRRMYQGNQ